MELSEFGRLLRPNIEKIYQQTEIVSAMAESHLQLENIPLQIGILNTIGPSIFSRFLSDFQKTNPGIDILISEHPLATLKSSLLNGSIEIALLSDPFEASDNFRSEPLYNERYLVVLPPGHRLAQYDGVSLSDISGEPYVDRLACELRDLLMQRAKTESVDLRASYRSDREDWIQAMVLAGVGFAFMPEYSITNTNLITRPLIKPAVERTINIVTVGSKPRSRFACVCIESLRAYSWPI